jgi:hypothetical protein
MLGLAMNEITLDPNTCYLEIVDAMHEGELELARELMLGLKHWFDIGGFYPAPLAKPAMDGYLDSVLRRTVHLP